MIEFVDVFRLQNAFLIRSVSFEEPDGYQEPGEHDQLIPPSIRLQMQAEPKVERRVFFHADQAVGYVAARAFKLGPTTAVAAGVAAQMLMGNDTSGSPLLRAQKVDGCVLIDFCPDDEAHVCHKENEVHLHEMWAFQTQAALEGALNSWIRFEELAA